MSDLVLRKLQVCDEAQFRSAVDEFARSNPDFEFAHDFGPGTDFRQYVEMLEKSSRGEDLREGLVPWTFLVGVLGKEIVGRLSIRHELNPFLEAVGGHIGYGVLPSHRRKGYATMLLKMALPLCASLGIERVLVTCDVDNIGSAKVIESCGGEFEGITDLPKLEVQKRRYWIRTKRHTEPGATDNPGDAQ